MIKIRQLLVACSFTVAMMINSNAIVVIYDDFSQPNYDTGSHTPYNVYHTNMWDGAPGGLGLPPNNGTTPDHTVLGTDLPGGVWQYGGGADQDYDASEVGNLAGYGASNIKLTGGTAYIPYTYVHNNENVGISLNGYNTNTQLTVSVYVCPQGNPCYVGFDSALNVANNFTGLEVSTTGGVSLIVNGSQVGSTIAFTGTWSSATASLLTYTVNTSTGAISNISLQGSTSTYGFTTTAFTAGATPYFSFFTPSGGAALFAYLTISATPLGSPPAAPTGLTAAPGNAQVALNWTGSMGATSYNVYRGTSPGGESSSAIATGITSTSYTNTGLTNGTTYYYKVTATNSYGTSGYSNEASATPVTVTTVIYDDFSQPNYDTGSHTPYNVYHTDMWDGAPGGAGLPPNNGTTPGHTVLGTDLPGGVWQYGGGADQDYDASEVGNLAGYGASNIELTGGTTDIPYTFVHNNENVGISLSGYNTNAQLTVSVYVCPQSNPCYVGFDSVLNVANNFSGLEVSTNGGVSLIVNDSQVGSTIAFTGTWSSATARLLTFTVNTSTGAISNISLQGSTSTYSFTTSAFTAAATPYLSFYTPSGGAAIFAYLTVTSTSGGGGSAPAAPTGLTATPGNAQVALAWTASSGATSYNVYRGTSAGGESGTAIATGITSTSYTNTGLTNGTTYYYKVTATNSYGASGYSNEASATPTSGTGVAAVSANAFLNSIGVCTHITQGADAESNVATCLTYAGIRNIRDDGTTNATTLQSFVTLHNATGALVDILPADFTVADCLSEYETLKAGGALLSAEGPNEPNNFPVTYNGATSSSTTALPTAQFMAALYTAVKGDSKLAGIPVFASSEAGGSEPNNVGLQYLTIPTPLPSGVLMPAGTQYGDYANPHNYVCGTNNAAPADNQAWDAEDPTLDSHWDGLYVEYGYTWWSPGYPGYSDTQLLTLPRVTTETGWTTSGASDSISLDQQGKLFLNLYLTAYKRGWSNTFIYYLHDTSSQGYWGLFDTNYNAKDSGTYLHNMTTVLADTTSFTPGLLNYTIPSEPSTVHDLLIQKSNGTYYLAVWDDRPVGEGTDNVTINLGGTYSVNEYDPTVGTSATNLGSVSSVTVSLSDHPIILAIP